LFLDLGKGRGLAICVRQSVIYSEIDISPSDVRLEISGIKVSGISIFNIYNPPSNHFAIESFDFLSAFQNVVLYGDFNSHHGMWGSQLSNSNGRNLIGVIDKYDYVCNLKYDCSNPFLSDWSSLMESVRFDLSFQFLGFALFQHGDQ